MGECQRSQDPFRPAFLALKSARPLQRVAGGFHNERDIAQPQGLPCSVVQHVDRSKPEMICRRKDANYRIADRDFDTSLQKRFEWRLQLAKSLMHVDIDTPGRAGV